MRSIAVIGGGITGVTTAYALAKRGFAVTVFEKNRYAAMETSYANGGQLSASNAEVWNSWPTIFHGMQWMMRKDAPLLVNPKPSWHKLSWFAEFVSNVPNYKSNTIETTRLAIAARQYLYDWAETEQIDFDLKQRGILHFYRTQSSFEHAGHVSKLLAAGGLTRRAVTPEEMREIEPALTGRFYGGYLTESDASGDLHKFSQGLAAAAERLGARFLWNRDVRAVHSSGSTVQVDINEAHTPASAPTSALAFDAVVICAGVRSRSLAASLGDRLNIYPVKGYSITVPLTDEQSQRAAPNVSLLDDATKLVSSRLGVDRLRVAGTAEFNGYNQDIRADRIKPLVDWVQSYFPEINTRQVIPWAGLRPMMPNMMPRVGRGRRENVYYNTGHGHLGWTLSAATAEMLADLLESRE
ncbi:D-amino acid dehydrogenase [Halothiobacillus sp.]|uniref:D-amino acid dehydrogenase n=1 Tax=Halothiobacillus sp. TaxID=1891311 RepID=UPI002AD327AB|nr:D-amino acid dehydrogenase [Halothiobacillus sp.]